MAVRNRDRRRFLILKVGLLPTVTPGHRRATGDDDDDVHRCQVLVPGPPVVLAERWGETLRLKHYAFRPPPPGGELHSRARRAQGEHKREIWARTGLRLDKDDVDFDNGFSRREAPKGVLLELVVLTQGNQPAVFCANQEVLFESRRKARVHAQTQEQGPPSYGLHNKEKHNFEERPPRNNQEGRKMRGQLRSEG
ncbi:hypothetical protein HC256_003304 [Beauveria bassiana]|nr:hypothetical protein HC256_003304 [Beauveria bassiana]